MNICFRVDSSTVIGTGHVVRCLTLAEQFRDKGFNVQFICRMLPGNIIDQILTAGYEVHKLQEADYKHLITEEMDNHRRWLAVDWTIDAQQTKEIIKSLDIPLDLLVVDHYAIDMKWENKLSQMCENIMIIDDLADRKHNCDFLLDQNYYTDLKNRYDKLVPDLCQKMLGPSFSLLRPEFNTARNSLKPRSGKIERVMVFFGGCDLSNQTKKVIDVIISSKISTIHFDIVLGNTNPHMDEVKNLCSNLANVKLHYQIDYMSELMAHSDLAIGGGGTTTWERCCLGLPCLTIAMAENQVTVAELSHKAGFALYLGYHTEVTTFHIEEALNRLLEQPEDLAKMSKTGTAFVDGLGSTRVVENILKYKSKSKQKI
ncbi:MAG: UDP-2,4-diacetamido-2,4,6-trideoxy-beta-L-altropyranose hydrolase [candidate division Zixibacteria bacterium]|nr:UDP-2,4-diacetamido-2,4,6-trideoxy-beta-L-altropyranose hydrolase [candidate division Zixibacteria bacterium]